MQWRETPNCRAASTCVRSSCVATRRRKASPSSLWEVFGPGRLCVRPPGLSHRYTLASPTLNLRAASALLPPPRTKLTTRMRKSNEHLMLYSSRVQPICLSVTEGLAITVGPLTSAMMVNVAGLSFSPLRRLIEAVWATSLLLPTLVTPSSADRDKTSCCSVAATSQAGQNNFPVPVTSSTMVPA